MDFVIEFHTDFCDGHCAWHFLSSECYFMLKAPIPILMSQFLKISNPENLLDPNFRFSKRPSIKPEIDMAKHRSVLNNLIQIQDQMTAITVHGRISEDNGESFRGRFAADLVLDRKNEARF